ncbi:hypothetical protein GF412_04100 [Candidatus Micrarchaeota archaeon]|nr:hypothetical protein [Candidatus Micrarchaeota archaeon]MBD3418132.1 hypothetical protein [Candidatus Micrarchaeota archaeon]
MGKYKCVFRNCHTLDTPGKGLMPPACVAKGCAGIFSKKPDCRTFVQDLLPPEPIMRAGGWEKVKISRAPLLQKQHKGSIFMAGMHPARAVVRT